TVTGDGGAGASFSSVIPVEADWVLVDVSYDSTNATVYVDGQAQGTASITASTVDAGGSLIVGGVSSGNAFGFDEVAVYPTALSSEQISAHFSLSGQWLDCSVFEVSACWAAAGRFVQNVSDAWVGFIGSEFAPGRNPDFVYLNLSGGPGLLTGFAPGPSGSL